MITVISEKVLKSAKKLNLSATWRRRFSIKLLFAEIKHFAKLSLVVLKTAFGVISRSASTLKNILIRSLQL